MSVNLVASLLKPMINQSLVDSIKGSVAKFVKEKTEEFGAELVLIAQAVPNSQDVAISIFKKTEPTTPIKELYLSQLAPEHVKALF